MSHVLLCVWLVPSHLTCLLPTRKQMNCCNTDATRVSTSYTRRSHPLAVPDFFNVPVDILQPPIAPFPFSSLTPTPPHPTCVLVHTQTYSQTHKCIHTIKLDTKLGPSPPSKIWYKNKRKYICVYIYVYTFTHKHTCTYMYIYIHVCTYMYIYIHVCTYMYIYIHMHIFVCVHTCMYIYIHTYVLRQRIVSIYKQPPLTPHHRHNITKIHHELTHENVLSSYTAT